MVPEDPTINTPQFSKSGKPNTTDPFDSSILNRVCDSSNNRLDHFPGIHRSFWTEDYLKNPDNPNPFENVFDIHPPEIEYIPELFHNLSGLQSYKVLMQLTGNAVPHVREHNSARTEIHLLFPDEKL